MLTVQLLFVVGIFMHVTFARPNDYPQIVPTVPTIETASDNNDESVQIPTSGVVYGMIFNFTSPVAIHSIASEPAETEDVTDVTSDAETSSPSGEKLVRKKRFLFGVIGSAIRSLQSDNWRECGRTPWGTTIYTNGFATACYGACPENFYCGYDGYGYGGYGYRSYGSQFNTVYLG